MIDALSQRKGLVIVTQQLVLIGRIDGPLVIATQRLVLVGRIDGPGYAGERDYGGQGFRAGHRRRATLI